MCFALCGAFFYPISKKKKNKKDVLCNFLWHYKIDRKKKNNIHHEHDDDDEENEKKLGLK